MRRRDADLNKDGDAFCDGHGDSRDEGIGKHTT